jgi:aryl-alcohol dehydrogenase-like predicted oxidoreductase
LPNLSADLLNKLILNKLVIYLSLKPFIMKYRSNRREFIRLSAAAAAGIALLPGYGFVTSRVSKPMTLPFGKIDFEVTRMGLGGQASIQWTPSDVDPVQIVLKAFGKGINYFDTSNVYGPSQLNYGKAFKELSLDPSRGGYNEILRRSMFLTTKTHLRHARGGDNTPGVSSATNGPKGSYTVDDVKRSLSQMFGDGQGNYPSGAYLDMVLIHNLNTLQEVDALYEGLYDTDPKAERIGALAALRDLKDGTNLTGLNPGEERLIKHIGFSGHYSPPVMVEMIQRDKTNLLDGMLIAINANDRLNHNMQHNVIPVAAAKNMGVIGMKVFADGALYTKEAHWTRGPQEVVRSIGSRELPSRHLIEYTLTTPGVQTAIIGIGQISDDRDLCQIEQNLSAAQVNPNAMNATDREEVEKLARLVKEGKTNYFQQPYTGLTAPAKIAVTQRNDQGERLVEVTWNTAFAGDMPLAGYEVLRDGKPVFKLLHKPQTTLSPFMAMDKVSDCDSHEYAVAVTDISGRSVISSAVRVEAL